MKIATLSGALCAFALSYAFPTALLTAQDGGRAASQAALVAAGKLLVLGDPVRHHESRAVDIDIVADGSMAVSAGWDRTAVVWDLDGQRGRRVLSGHGSPLNFARFCVGGTRVVTGAGDATLRIWDPSKGQELASVELDAVAAMGAVSSDGTLLATATADGVVEIRALPKLSAVAEVPMDGAAPTALCWSANGRFLVVGAEGRVAIWDHQVQGIAAAFDPGDDVDPSVTTVALSASGDRLAIGGDDTLSVWAFPEPGEEALVSTSGFEGELRSLRWVEDDTVVFADGAVLVCLRVDDEEVLWSHYEHRDAIGGVAVCSEQLFCGTASHDHSVRFWGLRSAEERFAPRGNRDTVRAVAWSSDGTRIAAGDYGNVTAIHDVRGKWPVVAHTRHDNAIVAATFSREAFEVVGADHKLVRMRDDGSFFGEPLEILGGDGALTGIAFGGDGFATVWDDGALQLHDGEGVLLDRAKAHGGGAFSIARFADGLLASAGDDGVVRIWKVVEEELEEQAFIEGFDGAPDLVGCGGELVGVLVGEAVVWSSKGEELRRFDLPEDDDVQCYCADEAHLVTGHWSGIRYWNVTDGSLVKELAGFASVPVSLALHPRGDGLAAGMVDGTVLVFR